MHYRKILYKYRVLLGILGVGAAGAVSFYWFYQDLWTGSSADFDSLIQVIEIYKIYHPGMTLSTTDLEFIADTLKE